MHWLLKLLRCRCKSKCTDMELDFSVGARDSIDNGQHSCAPTIAPMLPPLEATSPSYPDKDADEDNAFIIECRAKEGQSPYNPPRYDSLSPHPY